jgi:Tfp pilus assembly protein PilF
MTCSPALGQDTLLILYNNLGVIYAGNDQVDHATHYFDSARQIDPTNAAVLNNLANCYLCQSRIGEALNLFRLAYVADSLDKGKLFNWSVGLYVADSVEQSIELMKQFLDFTIDNPQARGFSALFSSQLDSIKGDAGKLGKSEIERLLAKARERMLLAAEKRHAIKGSSDSTKPRPSLRDSVVVVPAGAKSIELTQLARVLYWIIL